MIFFMRLEMLSQIGNPISQEGNLHFRRTRIALMDSKISNRLLFVFFSNHNRRSLPRSARTTEPISHRSFIFTTAIEPSGRPPWGQQHNR